MASKSLEAPRAAIAFALMAAGLFGSATTAAAQTIRIERPSEHEFILDRARLLTAADQEKISAICEALLADERVPLKVVTLEYMSDCCTKRSSIEWFSNTLFNQWGQVESDAGEAPWTRGVLLVVSTGDRRARIELGRE